MALSHRGRSRQFYRLITLKGKRLKQGIKGYHLDEEGDWVAVLVCGHFQHVRHKPPFINRPWVISEEGRDRMLGHLLNCKKCDLGAAKDEMN